MIRRRAVLDTKNPPGQVVNKEFTKIPAHEYLRVPTREYNPVHGGYPDALKFDKAMTKPQQDCCSNNDCDCLVCDYLLRKD